MSLEEALGHVFSDPNLLRLALTHRSVSSEDPERNDNERLEFLGDAVLQLVITDLLYGGRPDLAEGQMAKVRASVVSRPTLVDVARHLGLGSHVELAPGEAGTGGREKDSILADTLEALIGAVYLDGGLDAVTELILALWSDRVVERARQPGIKDYKTRLQEALAQDGTRPVYEVEGRGPDHDRRFTAVVSVQGRTLGRGEGRSKKDAEQAAAARALEALSGGPR
jgi:ribonuclease-3